MPNIYEAFNKLSKEKNLTQDKIDKFLQWYDDINKIAGKSENPGSLILFKSIWDKEIDIFKILLGLGFGAYINNSSYGISALHIAAGAGLLEFVKLLCDVPKIDIEITDNEGKTALYLAVENYHPQVRDFLLSKNAKVDIHANNGKRLIEVSEELYESLATAKLIVHNRNLWKEKSFRGVETIKDMIENSEKEEVQRHCLLRQHSSLQILTIPNNKIPREIFEKAQKCEATEEDFKKIEGNKNPLYATTFRPLPKNETANPENARSFG